MYNCSKMFRNFQMIGLVLIGLYEVFIGCTKDVTGYILNTTRKKRFPPPLLLNSQITLFPLTANRPYHHTLSLPSLLPLPTLIYSYLRYSSSSLIVHVIKFYINTFVFIIGETSCLFDRYLFNYFLSDLKSYYEVCFPAIIPGGVMCCLI